jgi:hypothetical protein
MQKVISLEGEFCLEQLEKKVKSLIKKGWTIDSIVTCPAYYCSGYVYAFIICHRS